MERDFMVVLLIMSIGSTVIMVFLYLFARRDLKRLYRSIETRPAKPLRVVSEVEKENYSLKKEVSEFAELVIQQKNKINQLTHALASGNKKSIELQRQLSGKKRH